MNLVTAVDLFIFVQRKALEFIFAVSLKKITKLHGETWYSIHENMRIPNYTTLSYGPPYYLKELTYKGAVYCIPRRRRPPIDPSPRRPIVAHVCTYIIRIQQKIYNNINTYLYNGRFTYAARIHIIIITQGKVFVGLCPRRPRDR